MVYSQLLFTLLSLSQTLLLAHAAVKVNVANLCGFGMLNTDIGYISANRRFTRLSGATLRGSLSLKEHLSARLRAVTKIELDLASGVTSSVTISNATYHVPVSVSFGGPCKSSMSCDATSQPCSSTPIICTAEHLDVSVTFCPPSLKRFPVALVRRQCPTPKLAAPTVTVTVDHTSITTHTTNRTPDGPSPTETPRLQDDRMEKKATLPPAIIVGAALGGAVALLLFGIAFVACMRRKAKLYLDNDSAEGGTTSLSSLAKHIDPYTQSPTISRPLISKTRSQWLQRSVWED